MEINRDYHQLLTHSIKLGGLAICNPVDTVESVDKASLVATCHLTLSVVETTAWFDLGTHFICTAKAGLAAQRDQLQNE